jgi:transcriptional regulator with XRE-family HTH domain
MTVEEMKKPQSISTRDLADIIRAFREMRQWSQDTLSAISKLSIRTIQRVENGEPSNCDTRRALALAFELEDADVFNKPFSLPNPEQIKAEAERLKREHVILNAQVAGSGQELGRLIEAADANSSSSAVELAGSAAEAFAGLVDYLRDFSECADCMSETEKLMAFAHVQEYLDTLRAAGFSVIYARRDTKVVAESWLNKTPMAMTIVYLVVYPKGSEPKMILAPRKVRF